jgi:inhibitor of KinA
VKATLHPAGDLALLVELDPEVSVEVNTRVRALEQLVHERRVVGVTETVAAFRSLLVYYDPLATDYAGLADSIASLADEARTARAPPTRRIELPCCYEDPELGFELEAAAARLGLASAELVRLHSAAEYPVYFLGFAPGQPYMTGTPQRLHIERLETPRTNTPAGSVGIGGEQCCVYSVESPGGFWVLGRTPVPIYDPAAAEPTLLKAGDRARFRAIGRAEYERIAREVEARSYRPVIA